MKRYDLLPFYEELVKIRDRHVGKFGDISLASYLAGEDYFKKDAPKLLVIGRALNGWPKAFSQLDAYSTLDSWENHEKYGSRMPGRSIWDTETKKYTEAPSGVCRALGWVTNTYIASEGKKRATVTARVPFWRAARRAYATVSGIAYEDAEAFYRHIAWTNLFKACPQSGGNPRGELWYDQIDICRDVLKREIEILEPTHVLVVALTNTDNKERESEWVVPFDGVFSGLKKTKTVYIHRPELRKASSVALEISQLCQTGKSQ